jgi:hypothetical protein
MGVQTHYKTRFKKKSCRKFLQNNRQENPKPIFLDFFNHVFGRFSARGSQKHDLKSRKKSDQHWYFLLFWPPRGTNQQPTTSGSVIFFKGPLAARQGHEASGGSRRGKRAGGPGKGGAEGKNKNKNKNKKGAMVPHVVAICQMSVAFPKKNSGAPWPRLGMAPARVQTLNRGNFPTTFFAGPSAVALRLRRAMVPARP